MVLRTLWSRLSNRFAPVGGESTSSENSQRTGSDEDETLSYADQVEYGVDEREIEDGDRVLRLLVKRGGRVDVDTIRQETGWSEEHLLTVVDGMEDDDQVSAITVGRKRVICRRGFEPKGYRSHLNE